MQDSPGLEGVKAVVVYALANAKRGQKAEIARRAGVEPPTVTKWSKGETTPSAEYWPALESILDDLSPGELSRVADSASRHPAAVGGFLATEAAVMQRLLLEVGRLGGEVWGRTKSARGPSVRPDLYATFHDDGTGREFLFEIKAKSHGTEALRNGVMELLWTEFVLISEAVKVLVIDDETPKSDVDLLRRFVADLGVSDFHIFRVTDIVEGDDWRSTLFEPEIEHVGRYYAERYALAAQSGDISEDIDLTDSSGTHQGGTPAEDE